MRKNKNLGLNLLYVSLITLITNILLKKLFQTSQEFYPQSQWVFYEFPSLSAQLAITFWLYLSYKSRRIILYIPTILIAFAPISKPSCGIICRNLLGVIPNRLASSVTFI